MNNQLTVLYNKWANISDKIRFLLVGGVNAAISYAIFVVCLFIIGKSHYQICVTLQWVLSSFISYYNQKTFVFMTKGNYVKEYLKCCSTWALSYFLNLIVLDLFVKYTKINVYISQFMSIFIVSVVTYVLFKYFAFKKKQ